MIGDIACDPDSDFSPIKVYDRTTDWDAPALRVHDDPPLDVTAIDNLPSLLPVESSRGLRGATAAVAADPGASGRRRLGPRAAEFHGFDGISKGLDMTIHWCGTGLSPSPAFAA